VHNLTPRMKSKSLQLKVVILAGKGA